MRSTTCGRKPPLLPYRIDSFVEPPHTVAKIPRRVSVIQPDGERWERREARVDPKLSALIPRISAMLDLVPKLILREVAGRVK